MEPIRNCHIQLDVPKCWCQKAIKVTSFVCLVISCQGRNCTFESTYVYFYVKKQFFTQLKVRLMILLRVVKITTVKNIHFESL
jgi:hypothetical protein